MILCRTCLGSTLIFPVPAAAATSADSPLPLLVLAAVLALLVINIAALLAFGLYTRIHREFSERRERRFRDRWGPLMYARMAGDDIVLPPLARPERMMFLRFWLHTLGYVRDETEATLVPLAREVGLEDWVLRLLGGRSLWKRILATRAAGALRMDAARGRLLHSAAEHRPHVSLAAAKALLSIDPEAGLRALQEILGHLDWSPASMVDTFRLGGDRAVQVVGIMIVAAPSGTAKQLIRLAELLGDSAVVPALRERLLSNRDRDEIAAVLHALGCLGSEKDRLAVRVFLKNTRWFVRMQAAFALGRIGLPEDRHDLVQLLRDREWWVRYRAAQSLLQILGRPALQELRRRESDRYAREMLERVLSKQE